MSLCDVCAPMALALIREGRDPIQTVNELRRWAILHDVPSDVEPEPPKLMEVPPQPNHPEELGSEDPFGGGGGEGGDASPLAGGE